MIEKMQFKSVNDCRDWAMQVGNNFSSGSFSHVFFNETKARKVFDAREVGYLKFIEAITSPEFKKLPAAVRNRFPKITKVVYFQSGKNKNKVVGVEMEALKHVNYETYRKNFGKIEWNVYCPEEIQNINKNDLAALKFLNEFVAKTNKTFNRGIKFDIHNCNIMVRSNRSKVPVFTDPVVVNQWSEIGNEMFG